MAKYGSSYPRGTVADDRCIDSDGNFKGAVIDIRNFVYGGPTKKLNIDDVNLFEVEYLRSFVTNTPLEEIDALKLIGPKHAYGCDYMFQNNKNLTDLILGDATHDLEIGTEPTYMGVPRYGQDTNINCTSKQKATADQGVVTYDHRNYPAYRLYTFVINYEGTDAENMKTKDFIARSYLRYYDGNGKLRIFYNDYSNNASYFGGCKCNFNKALAWYQQDKNQVN